MEHNDMPLTRAVMYLFNVENCTLSWALTSRKNPHKQEVIDFKHYFGEEVNGEILYSKKKIDTFLEEHISFEQFVELIKDFASERNKKINAIKEKCNLIGINYVSFGNRLNYTFLLKNDVDILLEYIKRVNKQPNKLYTGDEIVQELGLGRDKKEKLFEEYNIVPFITLKIDKYFHEEQLLYLKKIQQDLLHKIKQHYYTYADIKELTGGRRQLTPKLMEDQDEILYPFPVICKIKGEDYDYTYNETLISKQPVQDWIQKIKDDMKKAETFDKYLHSNPYQAYLELIDYFGIKFSDTSEFTRFHWMDFVRRSINKANQEEKKFKSTIILFVNITDLLSKFCHQKDIFKFSTKAILLGLFEEAVPLGWQLRLFSFIFNLTEVCRQAGISKLGYDIKDIPNPKHKIGVQDKTIYTIDEFFQLLDFVKNIPLHKEKAIEAAQKEMRGEKPIINYANMWTYATILLNNAWRSDDVLAFPKLPESFFPHISLEWLKENELSQDDTIFIADYYRGLPYRHGKTNAKRYFTISDELMQPFAYAVLISTVIQREMHPLSDRLFALVHKHSIYTYNHNAFFQSFDSERNFIFRGLKTNRTLMSYMVSVVGQLTKRNPVELVKFLRSHSDIEITNIYLEVPPDKVDEISEHLFSLDNFGFVYDSATTLLFQKDKEDKSKQLHQVALLKEQYTIEKLEGLAGFLNCIYEERNIVSDIINEMPIEELKLKHTLLKLGLSPSKSEDFQCLVGEENCPFGTRACEGCALNVPNIHTLSSINHRIHYKLSEFERFFETTPLEGEKTRLANQLLIERELLKFAIQKFGRERVDRFITGGIDGINQRFSRIPGFKEYLTIEERDVFQ